MPTWSVTIGGVERECRIGSLNIQEVANGVNTMRASFLSSGGAFRPALGAEIIITRDAVRQFGGYINKTAETGADKVPLDDIETLVDADSFNIIAERRFVYEVIAAGSTLKQALEQLEPYITPYGASLSGSQANGPALVSDVEFAGETFLEGIDYNKSLRMVEFGEVAAPFDVIDGDGNHVGDVEVQRSRGKYFNRVVVKYGDGIVDRTDTFVGDGAEDNFELTYRMIYSPTVGYGYVWNDDDPANPGQPQYETLDLAGQGASWSYDQTTNSITRDAGAPANLNDISITYPAQFPAIVVVEDAAEIIANGLFETVVSYPTVFDKPQAIALGESHLSQFLAILQTVKFDTFEPGLHPGQTITLTIADRNVSGDHFITEVKPFNPQNLQDLRWSVTAIDSETFRGTFRQLYRDWLGGGTKNANVGPPASSGGSGAAPPNRAVQFNRTGQFGGSGELLHDYDGAGETFGVLNLPATLAAMPDDENKLAAVFGNRTIGESHALTVWAEDDGEVSLEHDSDANFEINQYGTGDIVLDSENNISMTAENDIGRFVFAHFMLAADGLVVAQRSSSSSSFDMEEGGAEVPNTIFAFNTTSNDVTFNLQPVGTNWTGGTGYKRVIFVSNATGANKVIINPDGSELINGASTLTLWPKQAVLLYVPGTSLGWQILAFYGGYEGATVGGMTTATVTLTDAQIKALPTTPITLVAAPGSGLRVRLQSVSSYLKAGGGAYANINTTYSAIALTSDGGVWVSAGMVNDSSYTTDLTHVSGYLGAAAEWCIDWATPTVQTITEATDGTGEWFLVNPVGASLADSTNKAITLVMDNNGSGALTGGHASNSWRFICSYTIESVS
jgi:hypothetical protein